MRVIIPLDSQKITVTTRNSDSTLLNILLAFFLEENRRPVGRPVFKTGEMRYSCLVGSTPTSSESFNFCAL